MAILLRPSDSECLRGLFQALGMCVFSVSALRSVEKYRALTRLHPSQHTAFVSAAVSVHDLRHSAPEGLFQRAP